MIHTASETLPGWRVLTGNMWPNFSRKILSLCLFDPALRRLIPSRVRPTRKSSTSERVHGHKFRGVDFIELDTLLNDDERLVRDNTRLFIEDNLIPIIELCNREGRFPTELIKPMGELGFYGASLKGYGCAGMSAVEYGLMTQELERGDSGV